MSFLACGLFDTSIRATADVKTKIEEAKEKSREHELEFEKFIKDNQEFYQSLFQNDLLLNAFNDFSNDSFDFQDIEVDYSDISRIIADWIKEKEFKKEFKKEFEKEFFKEINKKLTERQDWRIHSWVFKKGTTNFNQEEMKKLSKEKIDEILREKNIETEKIDELIKEAKAVLLQKNVQIEMININDDDKPFVALAALLRKQNKSLPIWKIRQILNNVLNLQFKKELSKNILPTERRPLERAQSLELPTEGRPFLLKAKSF